ncbi:MAG: 3-methyl-2-oxobutanoate hydroxymethyltransferase [Planctomycetota bacterium]
MSDPHPARITLRTLQQRTADGQPFAMLTCYDATMARWLYRGGVDCLLVGDTAAEMVLGHDTTLPATMELMVTLTVAVRRGAPLACVMGDLPFGSYQGSPDAAVENAARLVAAGTADLVKLECDATFAPLIDRMTRAGVPAVAHLGARPQTVRVTGGYRSAGRTRAEAAAIAQAAADLAVAGAAAILLEAVPDEVAQAVKAAIRKAAPDRVVPVIGCGVGPSCDGHVIVVDDLLGLTDWQPKFAPPMTNLGEQIRDTAARWADDIRQGRYLADGGPYRPTD